MMIPEHNYEGDDNDDEGRIRILIYAPYGPSSPNLMLERPTPHAHQKKKKKKKKKQYKQTGKKI
jgi:hypothetical protein